MKDFSNYRQYLIANTENSNPVTIQEVQALKDIAKNYKTDTPLVNHLFDGAILLSTALVLVQQWMNRLSILKVATKDILAFVSKRDLAKKTEIENLLHEIRAITACDRVAVGLFHNGTTIGNIHFTKMSLVYEAVKDGIVSLKTTVKDIAIEHIEAEILLGNSEEFMRIDVDDSKLDPKCKKYLDSLSISTVYTRLLQFGNDNIYGIMQLHYFKPCEKSIIGDRQIQRIFNKATSLIENMIKVADKKKK